MNRDVLARLIADAMSASNDWIGRCMECGGDSDGSLSYAVADALIAAGLAGTQEDA